MRALLARYVARSELICFSGDCEEIQIASSRVSQSQQSSISQRIAELSIVSGILSTLGQRSLAIELDRKEM